MTNTNLITKPWQDYELIDSGGDRKLERFGEIILIRPETQALWKPAFPEKWLEANSEFLWEKGEGGKWKILKPTPDTWEMSWENTRFHLRRTNFKHIGIFPEQAANWEWASKQIKKLESPKVLNLFAYTGISSLAAAKAGAKVTHVDSSKQSLNWANENSALSGIEEGQIRYILDDALAFVKREVRRGSLYEGIILDPPAFGRGAKGEVWKVEEHLPVLMDLLSQLLSKEPGSFFLLNGYAAGYSATSFHQLTKEVFGDVDCEFGELLLEDSSGKHRQISSGIYTRFSR